jgi:hypothetical protein
MWSIAVTIPNNAENPLEMFYQRSLEKEARESLEHQR